MDNIFGVLFSVFRGTPNQNEWVIACLQGAWPKLLGDKLAGVCSPVSFDGSELVVEVNDHQWNDAVKSVRAELLEKLRSATSGEVIRIKIRNRGLEARQSAAVTETSS